MVEIPKCACGCGEVVIRTGRSGPIPRYASHACRMRALRRRRTNEIIAFDGLVPPVHVAVQSQRVDDQVARAILDARAVGYAMQRLGVVARPELAWRCTKLGESILGSLSETFPETER